MWDGCPYTHQAALDSARYVDDDLEGLLDGNGGDRFELDCFLSPPPELAENWMNHAPTTANRYKENMAGRDGAAGNIATVCTVNSDTPRRSMNAANGQSDAFREEKQSSSHRSDTATRAGELRTGGAQVSFSHSIDKEARDSSFLGQDIKDGLNSACLHPDRDVTRGKKIGASIPAGEVSVEGLNHDGNNSGRKDGITGDESGNELIRSWGIKDPCVAAMMLKRMRRLRKFHTREVRGGDYESIPSCLLFYLELPIRALYRMADRFAVSSFPDMQNEKGRHVLRCP